MSPTVDVVCPFCQGAGSRRMPTGRLISDLITERPELEMRRCSECKGTGVYQAIPVVDEKPQTPTYRGGNAPV